MALGDIKIKDPDATLDYAWDWSAWIEGGDTIAAAEVVSLDTAAAPVVVEPSPAVAIAAGIVTAWLSGGTAGTAAQVRCRITSAAGRVDDRTMEIRIRQR